jgi:hypothetical protein
MKNNIAIFCLILSALAPSLAMSADNVIKVRKQGTASVEEEYAQQVKKINVSTSDSTITTNEANSSGVTNSQNSMTAISKNVSDTEKNKSKQLLRFNPPTE